MSISTKIFNIIIKIKNYLIRSFYRINFSIKKLIKWNYVPQKVNNLKHQKTRIGNLPEGLQILNCGTNKITKIENLPESLQILFCGKNQITKIENLPRGLTYIDYDDNPITHIDNVPYDWYKERFGYFDLRFYNIIKRLQRRLRVRHIIIKEKSPYWAWPFIKA